MAPPTLQWNATAIMAISGSITKNIVLLNLDEYITSRSVFWAVENRDLTGSILQALVLAPKTGSATPNQRIIVTGEFTGSTSAFFQIITPGTPETNTTGHLYVGFTPDVTQFGSGTYVTGLWNSDQPFGANPRWSKYWSAGLMSAFAYIQMIESSETLYLAIRNPAGTSVYGFYAGAILQGYDSGTSEQGRVYGMAATGIGVPTTTAHGALTDWLGNNTTSNQNHAGVFAVSSSITHKEFQLIGKSTLAAFTAGSFPGQTQTAAQTMVGLPILAHATANSRAAGFYRQIFIYQDDYGEPYGLIMSGASSLSAVCVGAFISYGSLTAPTDTFLFISTGSA